MAKLNQLQDARIFRRVGNQARRREVKDDSIEIMVSLPSGDWGLGARAESLRGILLRRKSGKGESREVTGNHRTQQIWRPPSCFTYTPRYNNPVEAGVPGRQKGSVKPKPVSLLKEKSHCQCIFLPQVLS